MHASNRTDASADAAIARRGLAGRARRRGWRTASPCSSPRRSSPALTSTGACILPAALPSRRGSSLMGQRRSAPHRSPLPHSCEHCKALRDSTKTLRIRFLPEVLCVHLKRFKYDDYIPSKISTPVVFPLEGLSLKQYLSNYTPQTHSTYDLVAIINHRGGVGGMLASCAAGRPGPAHPPARPPARSTLGVAYAVHAASRRALRRLRPQRRGRALVRV